MEKLAGRAPIVDLSGQASDFAVDGGTFRALDRGPKFQITAERKERSLI
ncbi:MAG: hypothetical protein HC780_14820 [Leptolyngbyaceae cyanobacterium CSU_1_3]|nr:hypothetical protein [Leptolyngbyaceae cyanobacterium CSU_1_3]